MDLERPLNENGPHLDCTNDDKRDAAMNTRELHDFGVDLVLRKLENAKTKIVTDDKREIFVGEKRERLKVITRTYTPLSARFVDWNSGDEFGWLAVVLRYRDKDRIFVIPRETANNTSRKGSLTSRAKVDRWWPMKVAEDKLADWEDNFGLRIYPLAYDPAGGE